MKIRLPPASPQGAPTFHELEPQLLEDADLYRFVADHLDPQSGEIVLMRGSEEEMRPEFGSAPVKPESVLRGLTKLMWRVSAHPAAPDYLATRWEQLLAVTHDVLEQRRLRREPWLASVRRVRGNLIRTVRVDPRPPAGAGSRVEQVPVGLIDQTPEQEGQVFSAPELQALAETFRPAGEQVRAHVRLLETGRYRLLIGVRSLRASQLAGMPTLCCEVHEIVGARGTALIPPPDPLNPLARLEAIVRFEVTFPAWPEFAPSEVVESTPARRWAAELEHFRQEAAQDALADAEAALLEHEATLKQRRAEEEARELAEAERARQLEAAVERWIAENGTEFTRERHRRGWLTDWDIAWQIAHAALRQSRFDLLPAEPRPGVERRVARSDSEMEFILVLEADLTAAGLRAAEVRFSASPGEPDRLLASVHLPEPFAEASLLLAFAVPTPAAVRKPVAATQPPTRKKQTGAVKAEKPARKTTNGSKKVGEKAEEKIGEKRNAMSAEPPVAASRPKRSARAKGN